MFYGQWSVDPALPSTCAMYLSLGRAPEDARNAHAVYFPYWPILRDLLPHGLSLTPFDHPPRGQGLRYRADL